MVVAVVVHRSPQLLRQCRVGRRRLVAVGAGAHLVLQVVLRRLRLQED